MTYENKEDCLRALIGILDKDSRFQPVQVPFGTSGVGSDEITVIVFGEYSDIRIIDTSKLLKYLANRQKISSELIESLTLIGSLIPIPDALQYLPKEARNIILYNLNLISNLG